VRGIYRYVAQSDDERLNGHLAGEAIFFGSMATFELFAIFAVANAIYIPLSEEPGLERPRTRSRVSCGARERQHGDREKTRGDARHVIFNVRTFIADWRVVDNRMVRRSLRRVPTTVEMINRHCVPRISSGRAH
jgi:hypothetical protein